MEILKNLGWFTAGVLFASIGWGFVALMLFNMYLSAEKRYQDLRNKALKDIHALKTGGFKA